MLPHQFFRSPIFQIADIVSDVEFVCINTDLDRNATGIVIMNKGIENRFADCQFGIWVGFDPCHIVIGDLCFQIFCIKQINYPIGLIQQRTMNFILIKYICIIFKIADFRITAACYFFRIPVKSHNGSPLELPVICHKLQSFK